MAVLVRVEIPGLATRFIAQDLADNILTTDRNQARAFRNYTNADAAAGKFERLLKSLCRDDCDVFTEPD